MPRPEDDSSLPYRSALITGASSGIGKAVAEAFLKEGIEVYGTSRNPNRPELDSRINWLTMEGSDESTMADWIKDNDALLSKISILVNNCGSSIFGDISQLDSTDEKALRQLLLGTPIALTKAVLESMRKTGGAVVNVSSLAGQFPLPFMPGYSSAKAGLSAYTQSLMLTEKNSGVVLIDFQPGDFRTEFNSSIKKAEFSDNRESVVWSQLERQIGKAPNPEIAARDILSALHRGKSKVVRSGSFFQTKIAPLGIRLFPRSWLLAAIRSYYHLDKG